MATGGSLLVEALLARGVDTVFALPGVQLDGFFDALAGQPAVRVVHARHEQATSLMAYGYAAATGRVGVCGVVPGPGVLNAGAGLATAYAAYAPVLLVAGQIFGGDRALGSGALHEIPDQGAVIAGTIGATNRVRSVDEIGPALDAAFARLDGWPRRPAAIEIGPDVLLAVTDAAVPVAGTPPEPPRADPSRIEEAAAGLAGARRPLVVAGGGALLAGDALTRLATALGAPVVLTTEGKGAVPGAAPTTLPLAAGFALLDDADAVVIVGSRFNAGISTIGVAAGATVVRIDVDERRLDTVRSEGGALVGIHADAAEGADALAAAVAEVRAADAERDAVHAARIAEVRTAVVNGLAEHYPDTWAYCSAVRSALPPDGILVDEMTQVGYMARNGYPAALPRTYIGSGYQGTLGFGYCTALGAKVGRPDVPVVSISGDGGFLYGASEMATAVHHGIAVVAVVFRDDAFGNVRRIQRDVYGREIGSTLTNPDFAALARSFGVHGERVDDAGGLEGALRAAIDRDEPALIEAPQSLQPDIMSVVIGRRRL